MEFFAVVNDTDQLAVTAEGGRVHVPLWRTQADAEQHRDRLELANRTTGVVHRVVTVRVEATVECEVR